MPQPLVKILEKLADKYQDDEDVQMALDLAGDDEYMEGEEEVDLDIEMGPGVGDEESDESPDFSMLLEEDLEEPVDDEDEDIMPPKKKKKNKEEIY